MYLSVSLYFFLYHPDQEFGGFMDTVKIRIDCDVVVRCIFPLRMRKMFTMGSTFPIDAFHFLQSFIQAQLVSCGYPCRFALL